MSFLGWAYCIYAVSTLLSMATMSIGAALLLAALLWSLRGPGALAGAFRESLGGPWPKRLAWVSVALASACALSLIAGRLWPLEYGGRTAEIRFFREFSKAWYLLWPFVLALGLTRLSARDRDTVLNVWIAAFGVISVVGIVQFFTGWPRPQWIPGTDRYYHATLFLGHHLSVASIWIFPFFASLDRMRAAKGAPRALYAGAALLGATTLFLGYSRMLWLALPVGVLIWIIWALPRRKAWIAVAAALLALGVAIQTEPVRSRLTARMGVGERTTLWSANFEFLKERPLTGTGWRKNEQLAGIYLEERSGGQSVFAGHAHNNLIDLLGGTGLLGATAWLAWCAIALALAWVAREKGSFARGLVCAWLVFHLNGLTQVNFWEAKVQHQVMWVLAWSLVWTWERRRPSEAAR